MKISNLKFITVIFLAFVSSSLNAREKTIIDIVLDQKKVLKRKKKMKKKAVMRSEIYFAAVEKKLIKGINKTIKYLNRTFTSLPKKSPARLGIAEKLLNLHVEQASYIASTEYRKFDQIWKKWSVRRLGAEPELNDSKSRRIWKKVAAIASRTLAEFPKAKRGDVILYSKAISYMFVNKSTAASEIFGQVIKKYPNSNFAGDSYFALGDYYFDRAQFDVAIRYYLSAAKYQRSKRYGWSLFKLGWCHFNLGKYKDALSTWKKTVQYSKRERNKNTLRLKEEALRDMIYAFAELKMVNQAITYYKINGSKENINDTLMTFASIFMSQGRFQEAIKVYRKFLASNPYSEKAPEIRKEIAGFFYEIGSKKEMWRELERLPVKYGKASSWMRRHAADKELTKKTATMVKERVLYYAKLAHHNAQKSKKTNKILLAEAVRGYRLYLRFYPNTKESIEVKYLIGDVLYLQKKYRESAKSYAEIAMLGPKLAVIYQRNNKKENIHFKSAKYMLEAHFLDFKPEFERILKLKPSPNKPPRPLSARARGFIKACQIYTKWYSKDKKKKKECDIHLAEIYYRLNHQKEAKKYMWNLAMTYPGTREGSSAVDNLIPFYKNNKRGLVNVLRKLMTMESYKKGKMGKKLNKLFWGIKVEEVAAVKGTYEKARRYEKLVKDRPSIEDADKLLFNAAAGYVNMGYYPSAVRVYSTLIKNYPRSVHVTESVLKLAKIYDRNMQFKQAVRYYLEFTRRSKIKKERNSALTRACELKIITYDKTILATCAKLATIDLKNYKIIMQRLIRTLSLEKNYSTLMTLIKNYYLAKIPLTPDEKIVALYHLYRPAGAQKSSSNQYGTQIVSVFQKSGGRVSGEALRYVGEIIFSRVNSVLPRFSQIKLQGGSVNTLQASIKRKYMELNRLEEQYDKVIMTKDSYWGVAALHQKGVAYYDFAQALKNPPQIKGAKIADVRKQLLPQATALQARARGYFTSAQKTSRQFQVLNPWVARVNSRINMLAGKDRNFQEWVISPDFIGYEISQTLKSQVR